MISLRTDLPWSGDSASRFIPWLVAIMVFLGTLAVSGVAVFDTILSGWSKAVTGTVTVQIPALPADSEQEANQARTDRAVKALKDLPSVEGVRVLANTEIDALLAPWLGERAAASDLPLPDLIDVTLVDGSTATIEALRSAVTTVVHDAIIDDHRLWFEHLIDLTEGFRLLTIGVALIVTTALALTIVYATRASLAEFKEVISVLHLTGARDAYVATQFAKRTLSAAFKGSAGGLVAGAFALFAIGLLARNVESGFLPDIGLSLGFWVLPPLVSLFAATLATVTAFITVLSTLRSMV
ncbi:MAG: cell division protein [Rhodospirillaceae bacterium]|nr:cell division protein [Rhodospirillaceae bacterium]